MAQHRRLWRSQPSLSGASAWGGTRVLLIFPTLSTEAGAQRAKQREEVDFSGPPAPRLASPPDTCVLLPRSASPQLRRNSGGRTGGVAWIPQATCFLVQKLLGPQLLPYAGCLCLCDPSHINVIIRVGIDTDFLPSASSGSAGVGYCTPPCAAGSGMRLRFIAGDRLGGTGKGRETWQRQKNERSRRAPGSGLRRRDPNFACLLGCDSGAMSPAMFRQDRLHRTRLSPLDCVTGQHAVVGRVSAKLRFNNKRPPAEASVSHDSRG